MKFRLEIELGNDAMQTLDDVIAALQASRNSLADGNEPLTIGDNDRVLGDENGNNIGKWEVTKR
jgi:hypothetical protein